MLEVKLNLENTKIKTKDILEYKNQIEKYHNELKARALDYNDYVGWLELPTNYSKIEWGRGEDMYLPRLKDLREDKDMRQKEIAGVLGIDQRVYSTYETGRRDIPLRHLITLADFYGVTLDYLVGRKPPRKV